MKYYKILRNDLVHHGYLYHEGLNVDPNEWVYGECEPGGFYFTTAKHIFEFVNYGDLICDVEIPEGAKTGYYKTKSKANKIIVSNIRPLWTKSTFQELLKDGADVHTFNDYALIMAAEKNYPEIVKLLLDNGADVHTMDDYAFRMAANNGHIEVLKILLEANANIHVRNDLAFRWAVECGHIEIVEFLLHNCVDIHACNDYALRWAAGSRKEKLTLLLLGAGADIHALDDVSLKWVSELVIQNSKK